MSELIAEARVLVTPDTTAFRSLLIAEVGAASKGVVVPVPITPVVTGAGTAGAVAGTEALAASQLELTASINALNASLAAQTKALATVTAEEVAGAAASKVATTQAREEARVRREQVAASAAQARALSQTGRGAAATALSFSGLRGATLAATGPFLAGAAALTVLAKSLQGFAGFQTTLNVFGATAGATAGQLEQVSKAARQLGEDVTLPGVNAQDAATAMTELAKAGLSVQDSMDAARGVLQLATAAAIDNAAATDLAASSLNAFGLAGSDAVRVADVLANAANASQGSIVDIGIALQQSAAVGRQAGLTLEQTAAALTLLARNGLRGSDAGTSLRTALIRLINPAKSAQEEIDKLGLHLRTATGEINLNVFDEFARKTRDLTAAERDQALAVIFGQDAIRAAAILTREGAAGIDAQITALNKQGTAAELAAARTQGLAGAFENTKNQAASFGLTLGQITAGPVQGFVVGAGNLFESLNKISDKIGDFLHPKVDTSVNQSIDTLIEKVQGFQAAVATNPEFAPVFGQTIKELERSLTEAGQRLVREGFLTRFIDEFKKASPDVKKAMEDNVITPAEQAMLSATAVGRAFLAALPHTSQFFQSFGASAKSGIESAAAAVRAGGPEVAAALRFSIEDAAAQAKAVAAKGGTDTGEAFTQGMKLGLSGIQGAVADAFSAAASQARLGASAATSAVIDIQFRGGSNAQQIAALKRKLQDQQDLVGVLTAKGAPQKRIDEAKQQAIDTQDQIDSLQNQIDAAQKSAISKAEAAAAKRKSDALAAAAKIKADNTAADQAVFDSFTTRQQRIDLAGIKANQTAGLKDDLAVQVLIANTASQEIATIERTVKDQQARRDAIRERVKTLLAAGLEITSLRKQIAAAVQTSAQTARDLITDTLGKRLQLAELRGGRDQVLAAFNKAIADGNKRVALAKKLGKGLLDEQIKLAQLVKDRKDFIDNLKQDTSGLVGGTSLVDLFKENQDIFAQAGNVGQNAANLTSKAQNAPIRAIVQHQIDAKADPVAAAQKRSTDALTQAIVRLTETITGQNFSLGVPSAGGNRSTTISRAQALTEEQRFFYQKQARAMVEQGLG